MTFTLLTWAVRPSSRKSFLKIRALKVRVFALANLSDVQNTWLTASTPFFGEGEGIAQIPL